MDSELEKQLEKTGTAEISNGIVTQVTQALEETDISAKMLVFGELQEIKLRPINEVCPCDMAKLFPSKEDCQTFQKKDGEAIGFTKVICPEQFIR